MFQKLKIVPGEVYEKILKGHSVSNGSLYEHGSKRYEREDLYTNRLRKVVDNAYDAMVSQKKPFVEPLHLIIGMVQVGKGDAAESLISSGVTLEHCCQLLSLPYKPEKTVDIQ